jgi:hypothetical protein
VQSPLGKVSPQFAHKDHPVWAEVRPEFTPKDFANPYRMDVGFLRWLHGVRKEAGVPMWITSDARDADSDVGADLTAHKKLPCRAVDGQVKDEWKGMPGSEQLARIIIAAVKEGCVRIGVYKSKRGLGDIYHLDAETHPDNPSPRMWTKWT